jgi:choline dehydrogenase
MRLDADTVIVGAGSAGAVIAARATENGDRDVLLVEAGPDYLPYSDLPRDLADGTRNSMRKHDWGLMHRPTRPQVLLEFPRGKVVGGSSAVNTCIALRGQPYDYDEWAARGLPDWSWEKCLPAFKRIENDLDVVNEHHSQEGPIPIRRNKEQELTPWNRAFLATCASLGYPRCHDTNDPTTTGAGPHAMNKVDGVRMSAARCYLTPETRARKNFRILADTLVRRLRFDGRRVVGLEVETKKRVYEIRARRVLLCGGALATPCLLLRSGIGPRAIIERLGVDVVHDLAAVGARILDHPGCAIFLRPRSFGLISYAPSLVQTVMRYTSEGSECPNDMQLQPGNYVPLPRITLPFVTLAVCVGKPRGHGRMWIESASPNAKPRIESRFLEDEADRKRAIDGLALAYRCASQPEMKELATPLWPSRRTLEAREGIDRIIDRVCGSGYHPCGTVPMGADDDASAAVDGRGRVRGVEGLFVADASIMPTIPSSNTNLPTLMIGERFGAWLRDGDV